MELTCVCVCVFLPGVTGKVHLDENGDRETEFALWDMTDGDTHTFQVHTRPHNCVFVGTFIGIKLTPDP